MTPKWRRFKIIISKLYPIRYTVHEPHTTNIPPPIILSTYHDKRFTYDTLYDIQGHTPGVVEERGRGEWDEPIGMEPVGWLTYSSQHTRS